MSHRLPPSETLEKKVERLPNGTPKATEALQFRSRRWKGDTAEDVGLKRCGAVALRDTAAAEWRYHVHVQTSWAQLVALDVRRVTGSCSRSVRAMLQSAGIARATERYLVAAEDLPTPATLAAAQKAGDQASRLLARSWELARAEAAERRAAQPTGPADARALLAEGYTVRDVTPRDDTCGDHTLPYPTPHAAPPPHGNGASDTPSHDARSETGSPGVSGWNEPPSHTDVSETDQAVDLSPADAAAEASEAVGELSVLVGHGLLEEGDS